jgi:hypothetical protein
MASVLSESSSSTTTITTISRPARVGTFQNRPAGNRLREGSYILGEEPRQRQIRLDRLVAETLYGESSSEPRNAELGRAATRAFVNFGMNQAREKRRKTGSQRTALEQEKRESMTDKGWESIQDYGDFLGETADAFRMDTLTPSPLPTWKSMPSSTENVRGIPESSEVSLIDRQSWQKFRFGSDFAHLAPLTAHENRIQAQQSAKLIDWMSDSVNDGLFRGWGGLDQAIDPAPLSAEEQQQREATEREALQRILEASDDKSDDVQFKELGWRSAESRGNNTFAKYLAQEAPPLSPRYLGPRVTSVEPSRSNSMGGSDEDTRRVVSQDNHWRRTIFG